MKRLRVVAVLGLGLAACGDGGATVDAGARDAVAGGDAPVEDAVVGDAPVGDAMVGDAPAEDAMVADAGALDVLVDLGEVTTDADVPGRMFRDAGYSARIPGTNRSLWVFADSLVRNDDGTGCWPVFGIIPDGTAATAAATPGVAQLQEDPDDPGVCGTAHFLHVSTAANAACRAYADPATGEVAGTGYQALWARSAIGLPDTAPGSVLVFYQAFCNKPLPSGAWAYHPRDTGVARWDADDNPAGAAPTVPAAQQWDGLFAGQPLTPPLDAAQRGYSSGAVVDDQPGGAADYLYLFRHHATGTVAGKAVQVARVRLDDPALERYRTAASYEYWNGAAWQATSPADTVGLVATNVQTNDNLAVAWYPPLARYVMTYALAPRTIGGLTDTPVGVRTALSPLGPWSAERIFTLPAAARTGDCGPEAGSGPCRHYFVHPEHSRSGGLAISVVEPTFGGRHHLYELPDARLPTPP